MRHATLVAGSAVPDRFGQAFFAGAKSFVSCQYTCSHGISPGQGTFVMGPQVEALEEISDLILTDGVTTLRVPRCKIYDFDFSVGPRGQQVTLCFYDRRVFWEYPTISGRYNQPQEQFLTVPPVPYPLNPTGNPNPPPPPPPDPKEAPIKPWTKKTARELAKLCLGAMQEKGYDVSAVPDDVTPTVDWDRDNAAQALARLCDDLGLRVVYQPDADRVVIAKQGEGAQLPGGPILEGAPSVKIPDTPDKILLYGDYTQFQMRFALEAVGEDFDGRFVPINQLSYRPTTGDWSGAAPPCFANIPPDTVINKIVVGNPYLPGKRTQADAQALAAQWVFRAYRIRLTGADGKGKLVIPPDSKSALDVVKRAELVRLLPEGCLTVWDDLGKLSGTPARVFGKHVPPAAMFAPGLVPAGAYLKTTADTEVKIPFTVRCDDRFVGVVFHQYCFGQKDGKVFPAEIVLETACNVAQRETFQFVRYRRTLDLKLRRDIGPAVIVKNDVQYRVVAQYGPNNVFKKRVDNLTAVKARADYYLKGELRNYAGDQCDREVYPGFVPVTLDGATHQVTYTVGGGQGCRTEASRNSEHNKYLPQYAARRRIEETDLNATRRANEHQSRMRQFLKSPAAAMDRAWAGAGA